MAGQSLSSETPSVVPELKDVAWLAARLGVPKSWIFAQCRTRATNKPPLIRLGKYIRFDPTDPELAVWIAKHRQNGNGHNGQSR
jgi:hypothetical protein